MINVGSKFAFSICEICGFIKETLRFTIDLDLFILILPSFYANFPVQYR